MVLWFYNITGAITSTPTAALEALLGLLPLDFSINWRQKSSIHTVGRWSHKAVLQHVEPCQGSQRWLGLLCFEQDNGHHVHRRDL